MTATREGKVCEVVEVPLAPLPVPRHALVVVLHEDDAVGQAWETCLISTGGDVVSCRPKDPGAAKALQRADVVFSCLPWRRLRDLATHVDSSCAGAVFVQCMTGLMVDGSGFYLEPVPLDSVVQLSASLLTGCRVVGALQQFTPEQLFSAASGAFVSDAPVTGDDREATDLVQGVIDMVPGLDAVYMGGLRTAGAVEGLASIAREVAASHALSGGFRLGGATPQNLRFL